MTEVRVSASEFRRKQKHFFDLANKGKSIIIYHRNGTQYKLTPAEEIDPFFTPEMLAEIDEAIEEVKAGKYTVFDDKLKKELFGDIL